MVNLLGFGLDFGLEDKTFQRWISCKKRILKNTRQKVRIGLLMKNFCLWAIWNGYYFKTFLCTCLCHIELVRFQNSSASVLNLKRLSVPVLTGSIKTEIFGSGFRGFSFTVLTVPTFLIWVLKNLLPLLKKQVSQVYESLILWNWFNFTHKTVSHVSETLFFMWMSFKFSQDK